MANASEVLGQPPRFRQGGDPEYNWRELDRYLVRLHQMLGIVAGAKSVNVLDELDMDLHMMMVAEPMTTTADIDEVMDLSIAGSATTYDDSAETRCDCKLADSSTYDTDEDLLTAIWMEV